MMMQVAVSEEPVDGEKHFCFFQTAETGIIAQNIKKKYKMLQKCFRNVF